MARTPAQIGKANRRSWQLTHHARPWTLNTERRGGTGHHGRAKLTREWREAFRVLALAEHIPPLTTLQVHAHPFYRTARSLPDTAACVGSVKAAIDGLVDAGVIPEDGPTVVRTVTFHAPVVDRERTSDALTLWIAEWGPVSSLPELVASDGVQPAWLPEKEPF